MSTGRTFLWPVILILAVLTLAGTATAHDYVSSQGRFYIWYPDDWRQVDYTTVDYYLSNNQADQEAYNYDAVFAPDTSAPFYSGDYLILAVDTVGELSTKQIDSVVNDYGNVFGKKVSRLSTAEFFSQMKPKSTNYDPDTKLLALLNDIPSDSGEVRENLWVLKFYDKGIAYFYFYSPASLWPQSTTLFEKIVTSFSTENIEARMPRENLKLAEIESDGGGSGWTWYWSALVIAIVIVIIIIIIAVTRKRKQINR